MVKQLPLVLMVWVLPVLSVGPAPLQQDVRAMEAAAVGRIRTLNTAEITYAQFFKQGFACTLAQLGPARNGNPATDKPTPEAGNLVDSDLAAGRYHGYHFTVRCPDDHTPPDQVRVEAIPDDAGSGARAFCSEVHGSESNSKSSGGIGGGLIWYAKDGKAETCWINGIPLR